MALPNEQSSDSSPAAYDPPQYLLSSTGLSRDDLIAQYRGFRLSLQQTEAAPELVFERLVGNLTEALRETLMHGRTQEIDARNACPHEKTTFQGDLASAADPDKEAEKFRPAPVTAPIPAFATDKQTYLQFWFSSTTTSSSAYSSSSTTTRVRAAVTAASVPYGTASGWLDTNSLGTSVSRGHYDSRTDPLITSPTLPTTIAHVVRFGEPFPTPPKVLVWLTGLSAAAGAAVAVKATATDITETDFTLRISSVDGAALASVGAGWAVWSQTSSRVGSVSTVAPGCERVSVLAKEGSLAVGGRVALVAFCALDMVLSGDVWVELMQEDHGSDQLRWVMSAGPASASVYSARLGYATK